VKNVGDEDLINLPAHVADTPTDKVHWSYNLGNGHTETNLIYTFIQKMHNNDVPSPDDLLHTFIARRISPLQRHTHKFYQMGGCMDPNRMTTFELSKPEVLKKTKDIAQTHMEPEWEFDQEPHEPAHPAP
jgi:hypothetical protein